MTAAALAAYAAAVQPAVVVGFDIDGLDRVGMPVHAIAVWPEDGSPFHNGVGYGLDRDAARISAYGEAVEQIAAARALAALPRTRATFTDLLGERGERGVLDPSTACLEAGSAWTAATPLTWVPAVRAATGEQVLVPAELAAARPADLPEGRDGLVLPITNGLGAGPTWVHALAHALLELVQRDGNSVTYRALDRGVAVDLQGVADPGTLDLLARVDAAGIDVVVKLAGTPLGMADLVVVGRDRDPDAAPFGPMVTACGEAAHPDREVALRKALAEFVAARSRKRFNHAPLEDIAAVTPPGYLDRIRSGARFDEEGRALAAMLDWVSRSGSDLVGLIADPVLAVRERVPFTDLPATPVAGPDDLLVTVLARLADEDLDVLAVDLSPAVAGDGGDVVAVTAIVPGLEVETVSYGRIGLRNLARLSERGPLPGHPRPLVGVGTPPPGAAPLVLPATALARAGGRPWLDIAGLGRVASPLYPLYREPGRHAAALAGRHARDVPDGGTV